jgi:CHAD domain-containing protein
MPYHFKRRESLPDGIRRVVTEELNDAISYLNGKSNVKFDEATHEARKSVKKVRAALRLVRPDMGKAFDKANLRLRHIGRQLSEIRDAGALIGALEQLDKGNVSDAVRHALVARKTRIEQEKNVGELFPQLAKILGEIRRETKSWKLPHKGFGAIETGIEETYRSGKKALKRAQEKFGPDDFHELRKRVKDHWYQMRLLERVWADVLKGYEVSLKALETGLGDDHNLAVLREMIAASPESYGSQSEVDRFLESIQKRQKTLRDEALATAQLVYAERPRRLVGKAHDLWSVWKAA